MEPHQKPGDLLQERIVEIACDARHGGSGSASPTLPIWSNEGQLQAVRTKVGKRECWRIDVSSATCGPQSELFDKPAGDAAEDS